MRNGCVCGTSASSCGSTTGENPAAGRGATTHAEKLRSAAGSGKGEVLMDLPHSFRDDAGGGARPIPRPCPRTGAVWLLPHSPRPLRSVRIARSVPLACSVSVRALVRSPLVRSGPGRTGGSWSQGWSLVAGPGHVPSVGPLSPVGLVSLPRPSFRSPGQSLSNGSVLPTVSGPARALLAHSRFAAPLTPYGPTHTVGSQISMQESQIGGSWGLTTFRPRSG